MKFTIKSRNDILKQKFETNDAIISISTPADKPNSNYPEIKHNNVCFLEFDDLRDLHSGNVFIIGHQSVESDPIYFSESHAKKILDFYENNLDKNIYIHCDAGRSRSPGVAVALLKITSQNFKNYYIKYAPNELVVNTLFNYFCEHMQDYPKICELRRVG